MPRWPGERPTRVPCLRGRRAETSRPRLSACRMGHPVPTPTPHRHRCDATRSNNVLSPLLMWVDRLCRSELTAPALGETGAVHAQVGPGGAFGWSACLPTLAPRPHKKLTTPAQLGLTVRLRRNFGEVVLPCTRLLGHFRPSTCTDAARGHPESTLHRDTAHARPTSRSTATRPGTQDPSQ
jgi:hypothetical protein